MSTLILPLPADGIDATTRLAYVWSVDGVSASRQDTVTLDLLPADADDVVAVVPAQLLSWHRVTLPLGSVPRGALGERASVRLRAILGGLLEEQLLDDAADLHLALQPQASAGAPQWLAACNRAWLAAALAALAQAGKAVRRVVPELTPQSLTDSVLFAGDADAPWLAGVLHSTAGAGTAALSTGVEKTMAAPASAVAGLLVCPPSPAALARLHAVTHDADTTSLPTLLAEPALAALAERLCQRPARLQVRAERLLEAAQSPWNLAQFELAHVGSRQRWAGAWLALKAFAVAPAWRAARLALIVLVLFNLMGLNALAWREKALLAQQREAVRMVLTETFPRIPVVVDAPLQMAREVAQLQRHSGQAQRADLERLLAALAAAPTTPKIDSLDYAAEQLRVGGAALGDAQGVAAALAAQGLKLTAQGAQWLIADGAQP